jgi:peptidoglycan L-alanyl-D-glutamate endopeptidase CwlK
MSHQLDHRSERNLAGVHPDLVAVVRSAWASMSDRDDKLRFIVIEGLRTEKRQAELLASGASKTMNSRHLTGHAVDLMATVAGKGRWDWALYPKLSDAMKASAELHDVPIVWGGDWPRFRDGPHFELDRKEYRF